MQAGGSIVASGGGRGEMRGGEETVGGGREGAGVATGQVARGVLVAPTDGGKTEGG